VREAIKKGVGRRYVEASRDQSGGGGVEARGTGKKGGEKRERGQYILS